jgi:hypothetical protein
MVVDDEVGKVVLADAGIRECNDLIIVSGD